MKRNRKIQLTLLLTAAALPGLAYTLDWDRIEFWTGEGKNRSALVIQFQDNGPQAAYVWGFRWNPEDYEGGSPSGEDMFRAVAAENSDLLLFTQYTGNMGSTVDGIGFRFPDAGYVQDYLAYDFDGASADARVSFDYYTPNELMGQTDAPGMFTPVLCADAIEESRTTNIIEHPINALEYGYPAYDYDWWQPAEPLDNNKLRWNAGWYDGYWSYWVGGTDFDELSYSGLGMTSRKLSDGQVDAWKYTLLDGPVTSAPRREGQQNAPRKQIDSNTGASEQWHPFNYSHTNTATGVAVTAEGQDNTVSIHTLQGVLIITTTKPELMTAIDALPSGCYIIKNGSRTTKLIK